MVNFEYDSKVPGDNDFTRFAEEAVLKARRLLVVDTSRVPEDVLGEVVVD